MSTIPIEIGTSVHVGGCTGKINKITEQTVNVYGVYIYPSEYDNDPGYHEAWSFTYNRVELEKAPVWYKFKDGKIIWDASSIKHS